MKTSTLNEAEPVLEQSLGNHEPKGKVTPKEAKPEKPAKETK